MEMAKNGKNKNCCYTGNITELAIIWLKFWFWEKEEHFYLWLLWTPAELGKEKEKQTTKLTTKYWAEQFLSDSLCKVKNKENKPQNVKKKKIIYNNK